LRKFNLSVYDARIAAGTSNLTIESCIIKYGNVGISREVQHSR